MSKLEKTMDVDVYSLGHGVAQFDGDLGRKGARHRL